MPAEFPGRSTPTNAANESTCIDPNIDPNNYAPPPDIIPTMGAVAAAVEVKAYSAVVRESTALLVSKSELELPLRSIFL
eukprot:CAMPEP_0202979058 /NCGR_PEP_ID=MMETSP1396-20130829/85316_1 /ASSEMBLY_ACC=CAM_ASM_000872 /TAXON_ID= /ORGANISM="Pseudokeronopsis sp., Strain Brazil" /LENGTH=78 /DNA_ID=CAMNT_0049718317 /DNA_START=1455 /DNA_END=1694 /DNA_ORIENTATION=+